MAEQLFSWLNGRVDYTIYDAVRCCLSHILSLRLFLEIELGLD